MSAIRNQYHMTLKKTAVALWAIAMLLQSTAIAETITGKVVAVADGDTLTVMDSNRVHHKIRLAGIDAPEKAQAYGQRSKESLSELAFGREVAVETYKRDRYGREIGKVHVAGRDVNLIQVERGMAWWYRTYQTEQSANDRLLYESAEGSAQAGRDARACGPTRRLRHRGISDGAFGSTGSAWAHSCQRAHSRRRAAAWPIMPIHLSA